ncbi:hypothetical protein [Nostoc sp. MS1]|uniref:hypothetical protein n=1 Tax=Nostoc sp. MS1 TaxID=2764711 RepID=UPI001CC56B91|nr:hypothetical protein [Nostoc sp. MS1]BCL40286.1 hypothetical protein NSMS1_67330 [Nostoc sp. MS1]
MLQNFEDAETWQQAFETLEKIAINTRNMSAINVLTMLLDSSHHESILYILAQLLLMIDSENLRASEVLSQWIPPDMQLGFSKSYGKF